MTATVALAIYAALTTAYLVIALRANHDIVRELTTTRAERDEYRHQRDQAWRAARPELPGARVIKGRFGK